MLRTPPPRVLCSYFDDVSHFLFFQTAVPVTVIHLKGPFQFVRQFTAKHQIHRRHVLHEVYLAVLEGDRRLSVSHSEHVHMHSSIPI